MMYIHGSRTFYQPLLTTRRQWSRVHCHHYVVGVVLSRGNQACECAILTFMKEVFSKSNFSSSPGGNIYHWQDADTMFEVPHDGKYVIAITASAKNAAQNNSKDDDDLRVVIDDYDFGRQEVHQDKVSWKGFGVAASWDGASLQGGSKTVYFFMHLEAEEHRIQFWADEKPAIHEVRVVQIEETQNNAIEDVVLDFQEQAPGQKIDIHGIPWKAFIFTPGFNIVRLVDITAVAKSAKQKGGKDGDNIKTYVNGQVVHNAQSPTSDKYKNFFFSGDLSQGKREALMIPGQELLLPSNQDVSIELWYDETPVLERVKIELEGNSAYVQRGTLKRRIMDFFEASNLPLGHWDKWSNAYFYAIHALDIAFQYAKKHNFTFVDDEGILRSIVDNNEPDALRHFAWSVFLTQSINEKGANIITTNHEIFWMNVRNKQELSRGGVMDMWNNMQGRRYAALNIGSGYLELFENAKDSGDLILDLENVTEKHREEVEKIINDMQK